MSAQIFPAMHQHLDCLRLLHSQSSLKDGTPCKHPSASRLERPKDASIERLTFVCETSRDKVPLNLQCVRELPCGRLDGRRVNFSEEMDNLLSIVYESSDEFEISCKYFLSHPAGRKMIAAMFGHVANLGPFDANSFPTGKDVQRVSFSTRSNCRHNRQTLSFVPRSPDHNAISSCWSPRCHRSAV